MNVLQTNLNTNNIVSTKARISRIMSNNNDSSRGSSKNNLLLSQLTEKAPPSLPNKDSIKLLTFNTWGLKKVSKFKNERFEAIISLLSGKDTPNLKPIIEGLETDSDFDIIALQEVWTTNNRERIIEKLSSLYNCRFFSSGIITGPGLGTLTKFPIVDTWLLKFGINGVPWAVNRGDFFVGKSCAITEMEVQKGKRIVLLNSHMHAPYAQEGYNAYLCHRVCQAYEIYKLVKRVQRDPSASVVLVGDLNSKPGSLPYRIMTRMTGLVDSFVSDYQFVNSYLDAKNGAIHRNLRKNDFTINSNNPNISTNVEVMDVSQMDPLDQVRYAGTTCDSKLNTWRQDRQIWEACRLDYALIDPRKLRSVSSRVQMTEQIRGIGSLSDHFGYSCELKLEPSETYDDSIDAHEKMDILKEILNVIDDYTITAEREELWKLVYFVCALIYVIGSLVFITFTANRAGWSSVLVYMGGVFFSITGVFALVFGFVFGQKELRALREVRMQVVDELTTLKR